MHLRVTCLTGDAAAEMNIPCGEGNKTFKWLGLAAASRFTNRAPHGARRRREAAHITGPKVQYMPLEVYSEATTFYHPEHLIKDHLEDEAEVTVRLGTRLATTKRGHPDFPRWATIAFSVSSHQSDRRDRAMREQQAALDAHQRLKDQAAAEQKAKHYAMKAVGMREVMAEKLNDEHEVAMAVADDWKQMVRSANFDRVVRGAAEQLGCRETIKRHYKMLTEIFKNYSAATTSVGTSHELDTHEFGLFMQEAEIFPHGKPLRDATHIIFENSCNEVKTPMSMDQAEFFNALMRVAMLRCRGTWEEGQGATLVDGSAEPRGCDCDCDRYNNGGQGGVMWGNIQLPRIMPKPDPQPVDPNSAEEQPLQAFTDVDPAMPLPDALERLCSEYMRPMMEHQLKSAVARFAIESDEVLAMFYDHLPRLQEQFRRYSSEECAHDADIHEVSITMMEFGVMVEDSGMIGASQGNADTELTLKEVRQAFSSAQGEADSMGRPSATQAAQAALSANQLMSFPEFIEAIARIGCLKWEDPITPVPTKVKNATVAICEAEPRVHHRRK